MAKFDFEYIYEDLSSMRYHKMIEADTIYEAYHKFDHEMIDPYICVCDVNMIKE